MFSNWSPGFDTGIATLSWIVLLVLLVGIELVSSSTRVTSVKFHKRLSLTHSLTTRHIDRTRRPGSDKNGKKLTNVTFGLTYIHTFLSQFTAYIRVFQNCTFVAQK